MIEIRWQELVAAGLFVLCLSLGVGGCNYLSALSDRVNMETKILETRLPPALIK